MTAFLVELATYRYRDQQLLKRCCKNRKILSFLDRFWSSIGLSLGDELIKIWDYSWPG